MEKNNTLTIQKKELTKTLKSFYKNFLLKENRSGPFRIFYADKFDDFELKIENTNLGFSIGAKLNYEYAYHMNHKFYDKNVQIGDVLLDVAEITDIETRQEFYN